MLYKEILRRSEAKSLAPIAAVMPFVQSYEAFAKWYLSGKRDENICRAYCLASKKIENLLLNIQMS